MEPLISVIVPVYKVEQYLDECVQSIRNQTYTNLEIILVDDGSPDRCPEMCDEYANQDSRIKVIHKENGGISSARNAGIDIATGDYIGFVDSDDYIAPDMYEKLYSGFVEGNEEIFAVKCGSKQVLDDKMVTFFDAYLASNSIIKPEDYCNFLISSNCAVWNMLIKKRYVSKWFDIGKNNEDFLWHYYLGFDIEKYRLSIRIIPDELYYYRMVDGSLTHNSAVPFFLSLEANAFFLYNDAKSRGKDDLAEHLYVRYAATLLGFILVTIKNPIWRKQYYQKYQKKLYGLDWKLILPHWGIRHRIGLIIATYFPCLLHVSGIYNFVTINGALPPCSKKNL